MNDMIKVRENWCRRAAERQGLQVIKARRRDPNALDYGTYKLRDRRTGKLRGTGKLIGTPRGGPSTFDLQTLETELLRGEGEDNTASIEMYNTLLDRIETESAEVQKLIDQLLAEMERVPPAERSGGTFSKRFIELVRRQGELGRKLMLASDAIDKLKGTKDN